VAQRDEEVWRNGLREHRDSFWRSLPWTAWRKAAGEARQRFFSKSRPQRPYFAVDAPLAEVGTHLLTHYFRPSWDISYHYHGEAYNAARAVPGPYGHGDLVFQTHVRGYPGEGDGVELQAHSEPCPLSHPKEHILGTGFDYERGMADLNGALKLADFSFARRHPDG